MQRTLPAVLSLIALTVLGSLTPACKDEKADATDQTGKQPQVAPTEPVAQGGPGSAAEAGPDKADPGQAGSGGAEAGAAGAGEAGAAEAGAAEAGAAEAGAAEPVPADLIPGLFEQAKSLDTDDEAAKKALADAIAAGAAKIEAAKIGNARGEALMAAGESERAAVFFQWAADTHKLLGEPIYNLATLAAYAGDLEVAKEHLQELQKRGNKKLMKKVGVDPAFAPLADDPDVRKIYEQ